MEGHHRIQKHSMTISLTRNSTPYLANRVVAFGYAPIDCKCDNCMPFIDINTWFLVKTGYIDGVFISWRHLFHINFFCLQRIWCFVSIFISISSVLFCYSSDKFRWNFTRRYECDRIVWAEYAVWNSIVRPANLIMLPICVANCICPHERNVTCNYSFVIWRQSSLYILYVMMTSWQGNIFHVDGLLRDQSNVKGWIFLTNDH